MCHSSYVIKYDFSNVAIWQMSLELCFAFTNDLCYVKLKRWWSCTGSPTCGGRSTRKNTSLRRGQEGRRYSPRNGNSVRSGRSLRTLKFVFNLIFAFLFWHNLFHYHLQQQYTIYLLLMSKSIPYLDIVVYQDSNPWVQDFRWIQIHWAMAAPSEPFLLNVLP